MSAVDDLRDSLADPNAPWTQEFAMIAAALVEVADQVREISGVVYEVRNELPQ